MAQKNATKLTVKNGRKSKDGMAYNANHNTLEATRKQQSHIDQERTAQNIYIQFGRDGAMHFIKGGNGGFDARRHELRRYEQLYGAGLEARNERYKATRHDERCRTIKDLYQDPKTAPMETIFQVGNSKDDMSPEQRTQTLARAWEETAKLMQQKYGEHIVFLDSALHRDEAVDHIHCRVAFVGHDRHGHAVPSQNSALAAMGFERPDPSKPMTRYNNPTIPFTDELRETFYQACERRGIEVDREVKSYSKRQVEILEYKCEQYRLENAALEQMKNDHIRVAQEAEKKAKEAEERTKAAKKELEATKRLMESTTRKLRNQNLYLTNQIAQLNLQIEALTRTKEAAERAQTDAKNKRDVAVAAAKDMEEEQKRLFNIHNSRSIRAYGDYPAQPARKGITGKVIQEARPACTLVSTEDLNKLKEISAYSVTVDYTTATIAALDKKISENEIIQEQKDTISQLQQQIDNLERQNKEQSDTILQQGNTIHLQQQVLQQHGLDWMVQQFSQNQEQTQVQHQEHHQHHHR